MVQEYSISKFTKKCAASGRELQAGETYVSVLIPKGDEIQRIDVASTEWKPPYEGALGWWKCRMPDAGPKRLRPAPAGVLLDLLAELCDRPAKESLAYLLALLLLRRKILTEDEQLQLADISDEPSHLSLVSLADGRKWSVPIAIPSPEQAQSLQEELRQMLFTEE